MTNLKRICIFTLTRLARKSLSEKRPETDREILSRSKKFELPMAEVSHRHSAQSRKYSPDLAKHMAECDMNYHKLYKLFKDMRSKKTKTISLDFGDHAVKVRIAVTDRGPYTTTVFIDQVNGKKKWNVIPNISVRIYHDAKSAEVVSIENQSVFHGSYEYPNKKMRQPDEKEQNNKFLGEILSLCIEKGLGSVRFLNE